MKHTDSQKLNIVKMTGVSFWYRRNKHVINNMNLNICGGDRICLFGPSGQGKTTLLRLIMGLEKPKSGEIVRGKEQAADFPKTDDSTRKNDSDLLSISAVFQEDRLIPHFSALKNVTAFCQNEQEAKELMERLGLGDCMEQLPDQLSGGQKRRVALARALAHPFDLLVLDEAFTGLDKASKEICLEAVNEALTRNEQSALVISTHDLKEAEFLQARIINL